MISGAGLCWQHVGGVGSTTTTGTLDICMTSTMPIITLDIDMFIIVYMTRYSTCNMIGHMSMTI